MPILGEGTPQLLNEGIPLSESDDIGVLIPSNGHKWTFVLTTLAGTTIGEVMDAKDREVNLPLGRVPSAKFTVRLTNRWSPQIMTGAVRLKAYRDGVLRFHGPMISAEETASADGQSIQCIFAGGVWYLMKRLIGKGVAPRYNQGFQQGNASVQYDRMVIARNLLTVANGEAFTGISVGSMAGTSSSTAFGPVYWMPLADAIATLSASDTGFDWEVAPTEPSAVGGGTQIGVLNTAPTFGITKPNAIFEFGGGRSNVAQYTRSLDMSNMMTWGGVQFPGFPDASTQNVIVGGNAAAISQWGRLEDVVTGGDVAWDDLRAKVLIYNVGVRMQPRQQIIFTPISNARPTPFLDFVNGDTIRARGTLMGQQRFDVNMRVWGMNFKLDDNGSEAVDLTLITPGTTTTLDVSA